MVVEEVEAAVEGEGNPERIKRVVVKDRNIPFLRCVQIQCTKYHSGSFTSC